MIRSVFVFVVGCYVGLIDLKAQYKNIKLADVKEGIYSATGSSIAVSQKDPNMIVAGIPPDRVLYSFDGGQTWNETQLTSPNGVAGNPSLISDVKGHIYYFHRTDPGGQGKVGDRWLEQIAFHKTTDGGKQWEEGEQPIGLNPPKDQDYPLMATHLRKQNIYVTWTQFDKQDATDADCQANAMFSMSTSGGKKWTKAERLSPAGNCRNDGSTPAGAMSAVDTEGRVFATWSAGGTIYFDRSFDGGATWLSNDIVVTKQTIGWSLNIPGMSHVVAKPMMMIDNSTGPYQNLIYVMWADQRNGADDTDIWMIRSTNRGDNWTEPSKVNQDSSRHHQFMPWMTVDPTTGYVYVVYYDRRDHNDNQTDVYLSYSNDGGNHFTDVKLSETPFMPDESKFLSSYNAISAHKGIIAPIWTRMDGDTRSVITTILKQEDLFPAQPHPKKTK
jgi:photosystem II stability/assembly factor-like uncharacterized protein